LLSFIVYNEFVYLNETRLINITAWIGVFNSKDKLDLLVSDVDVYSELLRNTEYGWNDVLSIY
jgi:hypothetical protein